MPVLLAQCLCPNRHCILAAAQDEGTAEALLQTLQRTVQDMLLKGVINPHCGLCGARVEGWVYEVRRSPYATMAETAADMQVFEAAQAHTAARLKAQGRAYDSPIPPMKN